MRMAKTTARRWHGTQYPGVRYREHPTRKHGVRRDRYFVVRYVHGDRQREEGVGWASEGMTPQRAAAILAGIREAHRTATPGPRTLAERRDAERLERTKAKREQVTFGEYFETTYLPAAKPTMKPSYARRVEGLFRAWIAPTLGDVPLARIGPLDVERLRKRMTDAKRAPASVLYAFAVVRRAFNHARSVGAVAGDNPVGRVKLPRFDNARLRALTPNEARTLLAAVRARSELVYEASLLSLTAGLRAGEVFGLTWADVDLQRGLLTIRDPKSGRNRAAFLTGEASAMLKAKTRGAPSDPVLPRRGGGPINSVSVTFARTVADLGLNEGMTDRRQRVTFHTLRHTFATILAESGAGLQTIADLLGHRTLTMARRYSHLTDATRREAVRALEARLQFAAPLAVTRGERRGA
jgi:integrase